MPKDLKLAARRGEYTGRKGGRSQPLVGGAGRAHRSLLTRTFSRQGLDKLITDAQARLRAVGIETPWDWVQALPWRHAQVTSQTGPAWLKMAGRVAGWLDAVPRLRHLRRLFGACVSGRGIFSPWQRVDLWALLIARWPNPGRLDRVLELAKIRAQAFLACWPGVSVSWEDLAEAVMHHRRVGRVARYAACLALQTVIALRLRVSLSVEPWSRLDVVLQEAAPYRTALLEELAVVGSRRYTHRQGEMRSTLNWLARVTHRARYEHSLKDIEFLLAVPASAREARETAGEHLRDQFARFLAEPAHITALRNAVTVCPPDPMVNLMLTDALLDAGQGN